MVNRVHFQKLVERARVLPPLAAGVVYPVEADALQAALSGAFAGYLAPVLIGPEMRIRETANRAGLDISRLALVDTPDEPRSAAARAAALAREGQLDALIKGNLSNEELLSPIAASDSGLRGETRLSHATFLDLPGYSRGLVVADAQLNIAPNLAAKRDIVVNTLALTAALGMSAPNVALLAALDGPAPAFASTAEAVALKSMAGQGLFGKVVVDGPLTPDLALSPEAARTSGRRSEIVGNADVLIAPSMEAAIMVLRTLTGITGGMAAGVVLGAKVPVVASRRSDSIEVRMASCVLAMLVVAATRAKAHSVAPQQAGTQGPVTRPRVAA
ncbi:MAG TPA: bifunctional enoyl-CoA hydratase/phosphate acetyltransferase [Casimicrobiaceae bacterium]|nr:bifunctional enoyl-CoA hydratase/phosphate acetyltransferase [Casimicrobiaceae bacterium]